MLLTSRTYRLSQFPDKDRPKPSSPYLRLLPRPDEQRAAEEQARKMLLVHQTGAVKVGEVVRYTITYEPEADRVIPSPSNIHVRVKNASAIPLRAAYLNGPYALHVAAYPVTFDPNSKFQNPKRNGTPQFETNLKAGSSFSARLTIPEDLRVTTLSATGNRNQEKKTVTWIVEIASQVLFSNSAQVKFELLVGRDERSLEFNFAAVPSSRHVEIGQIQDNQSQKKRRHSNSGQPKGVYSKAVSLVVDDTESLWNRPALPVWEQAVDTVGRKSTDYRGQNHPPMRSRRQGKKKIHLVILTHGLHSNLGADMLYMKESIDATVKAARENASQRRQEARRGKSSTSKTKREDDHQGSSHKDYDSPSTAPLSGGQQDISEENEGIDDIDDEQVIVRGFPGNATRTENGIQYLGKRLARYILDLTYPDQPVRFVQKKSITQKLSDSVHKKKDGEDDKAKDRDKCDEGLPSHDRSKIRQEHASTEDLAYTFTSISFIGHSLGGLIQIYAMAYIQKHAPGFFDQIKPVNFVSMAAPMLGLSNENPMYVRFALDFGLVGRTGQDLGLSWRAPTLARSGWTAMVGGLGGGNDHTEEDPRAKPLLRVLPTGPAHIILRKFRNRTLYSNVVNDGIVPLRTSCLLFLDWRGLDKVEKARRDNGLVGTMIGWGWAEMTGQNAVGEPPIEHPESLSDSEDPEEHDHAGQDQSKVPQPAENAANEDETASVRSLKTTSSITPERRRPTSRLSRANTKEEMGPFETIWNYLRPSGKTTKTDLKMFKRSQTLSPSASSQNLSPASDRGENGSNSNKNGSLARPVATRGDSIDEARNQNAPPKTTIFESAADLLSPPTPPMQWILDPSARARTIFHDRVYHPEDIPAPPSPKSHGAGSTLSVDSRRTSASNDPTAAGGMRVEERIARAYHRDLSWRKVLVRLEPDAHNNMIVRRMFANAYGWPVVKHVCDTHFGDTYTAITRDEHEPAVERAKPVDEPVGNDGERVTGQESNKAPERPEEMMRQTTDELSPLKHHGPDKVVASVQQADSIEVDDSYLDDTSSEDEEEQRGPLQTVQRFWSPGPKSPASPSESSQAMGTTADLGLPKSAQNTLSNPLSTGSSQAGELNRSLSITEQIVQSAKTSQPDMDGGRL